jgi:ribonuclease P protein component
VVPRHHRLRRSSQFDLAVRGGVRSGRRHLVVHLYVGPEAPTPGQIGVVVSKAVGGSVVRHRVARRIRHLMSARMSTLPAACLVVIRANPAAAGASFATLAGDLDIALGSAGRMVGQSNSTSEASVTT